MTIRQSLVGLAFLVQRHPLLVRYLTLLVQQPPQLVQQLPLRMQHLLPAQHLLLAQHLPPLSLFVRHLALLVQQPPHPVQQLPLLSQHLLLAQHLPPLPLFASPAHRMHSCTHQILERMSRFRGEKERTGRNMDGAEIGWRDGLE